MHAFLQRDFSQAKDKSAAVKNAYVLVDKKRYLHALAFFILGDKVEECIRFCLDRLKDVSLAFLFCLMFKNINRDTLMTCMQTDGDIWIKHIACVLDNRHIDSYNVLFEIAAEKWEYQPSLTGFHPAAIYFANRLLKTVPLRR